MNKGLFLDLDSTLIKTKSGKDFPENIYDWELINNTVEVAKKYQEDGYKIFIVTNQGGIELGHETEDNMLLKFDSIDNKLEEEGLYIDYWNYCSKMKSFNRKPNPGMAFTIQRKFNIDLKNSVMVGDRSSDKEFADNAKISTYYDVKDFKF